MKVILNRLNPFRVSRPRVVVQAAPPPVIVQAAPPSVVIRVDPQEWPVALARKQARRAVLAQELATLDTEIAALIVKIG